MTRVTCRLFLVILALAYRPVAQNTVNLVITLAGTNIESCNSVLFTYGTSGFEDPPEAVYLSVKAESTTDNSVTVL
jgi:hypothetical protein